MLTRLPEGTDRKMGYDESGCSKNGGLNPKPNPNPNPDLTKSLNPFSNASPT